jgi:S1-C subfamily serine protease
MRPFVFAVLSYIAVGACAAFGQTPGDDLPQISPAMEEQGTPFVKETLGADAALSVQQLRDMGSDLPIAQLSRIARQPIAEAAGQARSAADAQIYRTVSPSVVMVVAGDSIGSGSMINPFGDVLTNLHVVRGFTEVAIVLKPANTKLCDLDRRREELS